MQTTHHTIMRMQHQRDRVSRVLALAMSLFHFAAVCGSDHSPLPAAGGAPAGVQLTVRGNPDAGTLIATQFVNSATGFNWLAAPSAVGPIVEQGAGDGGSEADQRGSFRLTACDMHKAKNGLDTIEAQWLRADGLELRWSAKNNVGVMEFQSEIRNTGRAEARDITAVSPLACDLAIRPEDLQVHYLDRIQYRKMQFSGCGEVCGGAWNAPQSAGWIALENSRENEVLFLGIEWESYWKLELKPCDRGVRLVCSLATGTTALASGACLKSARVFLGMSHGNVDDSLRVLHDHLRRIMPPIPPNFPWVSCDIWGTEANGVEAGILAEIPIAADMGIELFYVDAGWYEGSCHNGSGDWFTGVGNWSREDRIKYPGGLANISQKVHAAGMKFGLWFAPQVCDSRLVGSVVPEQCVAQRDGQDITLTVNDWAPITQICLGNPKTVEYLQHALGDAVERYDLDWLKWDNSGLPGPVCNRADHGHQAGDGALAALQGQYRIWAYLHERFPKLVLEQCGYPSRLDYGLARFAQAHWLADSTEPALRVRQNQLHASYVYPAAHNEAWVIRCQEIENTTDPLLLDTLVRSRMVGFFGIGTLTGRLTERASLYPDEVRDALKRNIGTYKQYRHLLREDVYHILPPSIQDDAWDAIQFCKRDGTESVLIVFRSNNPSAEQTFPLRGLLREANYDVTSHNGNPTSIASGEELSRGLKVTLPQRDMSDIIQLKCSSLRVSETPAHGE